MTRAQKINLLNSLKALAACNVSSDNLQMWLSSIYQAFVLNGGTDKNPTQMWNVFFKIVTIGGEQVVAFRKQGASMSSDIKSEKERLAILIVDLEKEIDLHLNETNI